MNVGSFLKLRRFSLVLPAFLAVCSYFLFKAATTQHIVKAESQIVPYTFRAEVYLYGSNPAGELHSTLEEARRSDGAIVEIRSMRPLARELYGRTIRYPDGGIVSLVDTLGYRTSFPPSRGKDAASYRRIHLNPPSNCVFDGEILLSEKDTVLGHPVDTIRHDALDGIRITEWRAPDLGCAQLQSRIEQQQPDGSYKLMSQQKAVSLQVAPPDPHLFKTGQDYVEVGPSQMATAIRESLGYSSPGPAAESAAKFDQAYKHGLAANADWVVTH